MPRVKVPLGGGEVEIDYPEEVTMETIQRDLRERFNAAKGAIGSMHWLDRVALFSAPIPIVGDIAGVSADARMFAQEPESRTWGNAAMAAAGALPFVPAASQTRFVSAVARRADDTDLPALDYRGGHTAPVDPEYHAPLHDMTKTYPEDIYSRDAIRYYGHGDAAMDKQSFDVIQKVRGKPDQNVIMYRAVPEDAPDEIFPGDWVTTNKRYAEEHAELLRERGESPKVLISEAPAKKLRTDGNSPHEYGYTGAMLGAAVLTGAVANERSKRKDEEI